MLPEQVIYVLIILYVSINECFCGDAIVTTCSGKIGGKVSLNWDNEKFYSFTGIPYAQAPVGKLRFKAPVAYDKWDDILDATQPAPFCPQFAYDDLVGDEDCLYLNVYTKSIKGCKKRPVMVYIHGGGYRIGTGSSLLYGAEFFMTEDVVLVTINYRLGFLGALSFKDQTKGVPGNAHLKDQVMALKWVQQHIENFCGDKDSVTVFGESAGGASTHSHLLSPMSRGLVHKVIAQSGCAFNSWNIGVLGTGDEIAKNLGITGSTVEIIEKMQQMPWQEFVRKTIQPGELGVPINAPLALAPVIETQLNEPAFFNKRPMDLVAEAPKNIPIMLGYNNNDTIIFETMRYLYSGKPFYFDKNFDVTIPYDLKISEEDRPALVELIQSTYFEDEQHQFAMTIDRVLRYSLGPWFFGGFIQAVEKHLEAGHELYFYLFSSDSRLNYFKRLHPVTRLYHGASHMDELGYLFTTEYTPMFRSTSNEEDGWRTALKVWTSFATNGNPTIDKCELDWKRVDDAQNINYVNINLDKLEQHHEPDKENWDFWRRLYHKYNKC